MLRRAFAVITAFTVAHSLTLAPRRDRLRPDSSQPVEVAIALSVMIAALAEYLARRGCARARKLAFAFAWSNGLGSQRTGRIASGTDRPVGARGFNVGIETAQVGNRCRGRAADLVAVPRPA
jgi:hypothetical protein